MYYLRFIISISVLFHFKNQINAINCDISENEYNALHDFYTSTNGDNWFNTINDNNKWVFSNLFNTNDLSLPCTTPWYGLTCRNAKIDHDNFTSFNCPLYSAANTNSAKKNYDTCGVYACPGSQIVISGCDHSGLCNGDQYLLLFDSSNNQVASNDDTCGFCSEITYEIPSGMKCQNYSIHEGCYGNYSCSGILSVAISEVQTNTTCIVTGIDLHNNNLQGSITKEIDKFHNLTYLYLHDNLISNSIPSQISQLIELKYLYLYDNRISNSIPTELGLLHNLLHLGLSSNQLSSSIPSELSQLVVLKNLYLYNNYLSNSIPSELGQLVELTYLNLGRNQFTNIIPSQLGQLVELTYLGLESNSLSKSIPTEFGQLIELKYLVLNSNHLCNSIPSELGQLVQLTTLLLYNNYLSNSIPLTMQNLINLQIIKLNNNLLYGKLDNIFNSRIQKNISLIDISENFLIGTLTEDIFNIQSLESFVAYSNCISGNIPINICPLPKLNSLILDGLSSSCINKNYIFPQDVFIKLPKSFQLNSFIGNIHECLFNMSNLEILHLSGIGLEGSLSNSIVISSSLKQLSLSHNLFSNKIPIVIQENNWNELDLSFNKFNGIIDIKHINYPIKLDNNLLSGDIPSSLINTNESISILSGNLFACSIINPELKLPENDKDINHYSCGSNNFNIAITLFSVIIIIVYLIKSKIWLCNREYICDFLILSITLRHHYDINLNILKNEGIKNSKKLINGELNINNGLETNEDTINEIESIRMSKNFPKPVNLCNNITSLCELSDKLRKILLVLIFYIIIVWLPISILLNYYYGVYQYSYLYSISSTFLSGIFPSVIILILITISIIGMYYIQKNVLFNNIHNNNSMVIIENQDIDYTRKLSLFTVLLVNVIVMFIINGLFIYATFNLNTINIFLIEIALSFLKIVWKWSLLPLIIRKIKRYIINNNNVSNDEVLFQCMIGVINNIFIPLIASAFLSPHCFEGVFVPPVEILSSYTYQPCTQIDPDNNCRKKEIITQFTRYDSPFIYSYYCSSSVATTYSSIYIIMGVFLFTIGPLSIIFFDNFYSKINHNLTIFKIINKIIPERFKPLNFIKDDKINNVKYFNQTRFIVNIVNYISIIVTIGFIIPIVGIVCSISLSIYIHNTLSNMGERIIKEEVNKEKILNNYETNSKNICKALDYCLKKILLPVIFIFYSFFINDIIGRNEFYLICARYLFLVIIILSLIIIIYKKIINNSNERNEINMIHFENNIELIDTTNINEIHKNKTNYKDKELI